MTTASSVSVELNVYCNDTIPTVTGAILTTNAG